MNVQFYKIAEEVKNLDLVDKVFLKELFEKWIIEEKRELIKKHAEESLNEYKSGKIKFYL